MPKRVKTLKTHPKLNRDWLKAFSNGLKTAVRNYKVYNKESYKPGKARKSSKKLKTLVWSWWKPLNNFCNSELTCINILLGLAAENFPIQPTLVDIIGDIRALYQGIIKNVDTRAKRYTDAVNSILRGIEYRYTKGVPNKKFSGAQQKIYANERSIARQLLKLDSDSRSLRIQRHQRIKKASNIDQIPIRYHLIKKLKERIDKSTRPIDMIMSVQLATGSRVSEVLTKSKYVKDSYNRSNWFKAVGLAKKRKLTPFWDIDVEGDSVKLPSIDDQEVDNVDVARYDISNIHEIVKQTRAADDKHKSDIKKDRKNTHPDREDIDNQREGPLWGLTLQQLQQKVKRIRATVKQKDSSSWSHKISVELQDYFADRRLSGHKLRAIYGNYTYDNFSHGKKYMSRAAWLSNVLGHYGDNISTAQAYTNVRIIYKLEANKTLAAQLNDTQADMQIKLDDLHETVKRIRDGQEGVDNTDKPKDVVLWTKDGEEVHMQKRKRRKGALANDLGRYINELEKKGVPTTYSVLRRLGFGSSSIHKWRKLSDVVTFHIQKSKPKAQ